MRAKLHRLKKRPPSDSRPLADGQPTHPTRANFLRLRSLSMQLSNFFYRNPRLTLLAVCLILVSGLSSWFVLPRMEDPQLVQRGAIVNTIYPGADPTRVESLVTEKIEEAMEEIEQIKEIRSSSREGISTLTIELRDDVLNSTPVWSRIRDRLSDIEPLLPAGALKPNFDELEFKAFALLVALKWDQESPVNYAILNRLALQLKDHLQTVVGTQKVETHGAPSEEILVRLNSNRLAALNLTVQSVSDQIRQSDAKVSAGQLRGSEEELLLGVSGDLNSLQQIEQIPIMHQTGEGFTRLGDIATVLKTAFDPPDGIAIVDGQRAVVVGAYVRNNSRIDLWSAEANRALDEYEAQLPRGISMNRLFDQNKYVATRLTTLIGNLLLGAAAVFCVIFLVMGWRSAVVVSTALPLSALMVLTGMRVLEVPVHQMSVTGLIIALGLLIDNAIVIVDETSKALREGLKPAAAVSRSVRLLFFPLLGSTVTTALTFAPIALMPGPAGEFVGAIAVNVILAIFSSLFLAMTIIPALAAALAPANERQAENDHDEPAAQPLKRQRWWRSGLSNARLNQAYCRLLDFIYAKPWIGVAIGIVAPVAGFVAATQLSEQFFPPSDRDQIHIELELSPQSSIAATLETTKQIREELLRDQDVQKVDWFVGESAPAFYYNLIPKRASVSQYAQALVQLTTIENQSEIIHRLQGKLDQKFAHARVLVRQLEQGPPFDAPVEVRLFGPDLARLRELGQQLRRILVDTPGVIHTRCELDEVLPRVRMSVKDEVARAAGLSLTEIARQVNSLTEGVTGGSVIEGTEELPVRVRIDRSDSQTLAQLACLEILNQTPAGGSVGSGPNSRGSFRGIPVSALASFDLEPEYGAINHLHSQRMNEIQVYIPAGVLPSSVLGAFQDRLERSDFRIPDGYQLRYGGESAKRDEAVGNLIASVGILLVMMVATLVLSFGSFRIAAIVGFVGMLSAGLGMGSLWIFGYPFGFTAIIGTMGLLGVAINDTIVVLAAIKNDEAARSGDRLGMRRVVNHSTRHIVSTSLTTMAGFTPLIIGGGGFWPPTAVAIAGGVAGATLLALILAPSCYLLLMCSGKQA